jgi:hypothetical protein
VSYFRPQKAGKIGPRTVHSFSDSTSRLSQKAGQVIPAKCALSECLKLRIQSTREPMTILLAACAFDRRIAAYCLERRPT